MNRKRVQTALFFGLLALGLGLSLALLFPFLRPIAWAVVLAVAVYPFHRRLSRRIHRPSIASAISCLLVVVAVLVPLTVVMIEVTKEASALARQSSLTASNGGPPVWAHPLDHPALHSAQRWLERTLGHVQWDLVATLRQAIGQLASFLAMEGMAFLKNAVWLGVQAVVTLVTLFFLLRDGPKMLPALRAFLPMEDAQAETLVNRVTDMIHATVYGQTAVAVSQGVLDGLAFWILGVPSPVLWGVLLAIVCMVPLVGAPFVWVPAALLLAARGSYWQAVVLAIWALLMHNTIDHLLRPLIIGARTQTHLLIAFFGVLGGLMLLGPVGLFLGPVILVVTLALLDMLRVQIAPAGAAKPAPETNPEAASPRDHTLRPASVS
ncbi:MAG TPA: AI-2E family transporter [Chthonomonadaceae bacterium]|nr:AI-2E family transporter [Chthonomonadaceae bacterium]